MSSKPIVVLKFGSSVLVDRDSLPEVVSEIYRAVRDGKRVVAVASAFYGVTDKLLEDTALGGCAHDNVNAPAYIATGEEASAALVALACDRSGLCSVALKTPELGIVAQGPLSDAWPVALKRESLDRALAQFDVVVVPGFVASDANGRTVLLGRGGSDLTAVFLADALKAERVRLIKDVDGVYDRDPAAAADALRYERIDWARARAVASELIQVRALEYASQHDVTVEVGAIGAPDATIIAKAGAAPVTRPRPRKLRVALAGHGVVGTGLAERLLHRPEAFEIVGVLVRDTERPREGRLAKRLFTDNPRKLLAKGADVVVDALSSAEAGAELSLAALQAGVDVVSANKQAVIRAFGELAASAKDNGAALHYSAAVGGGSPVLETVAKVRRAGAEIDAVEGVLNGTVNFLLERIADGDSFDEALAKARKAGLAEEDPSSDLNGADAAAKIRLVALAAFGVAPAAPTVAALDAEIVKAAAQKRLKHVARLFWRDGELHGSIGFEPADGGPFDVLRGDRNGIRITTRDGRVWTAQGRGAGRWPTTESLFADLIDLRAARSFAPARTNATVALPEAAYA